MTLQEFANKHPVGVVVGVALPLIAAILWMIFRPEKREFVVFIFPDPTHTQQLFLNGQPIDKYELDEYASKLYAKAYRIAAKENQGVLEIRSAKGTEYQNSIKPGSYLVNLSKSNWVSWEEVRYGSSNTGGEGYLKNGDFGVHYIGSSTDVMAFDFDQQPPNSIKESAKHPHVYIKLSATPK